MGTWGVSLDGIYLSGGSSTADNLTPDCPEQTNVGCLTSPPAGLGVPGLRTEDVTFVQRDGVVHYSDWYEPRIITLEKVVVCDDGCGGFDSSCSARQKVRDLLTAWSRKCCDTELVIYTPCNSVTYDSVPTPELQQTRTNLFAYNSRGQGYSANCGTFEVTNVRGFAGTTGTYTQYAEGVDLPANLVAPQNVARKTWTGNVVSYCRDYSGSGRCYVTACSGGASGFTYNNVVLGSNDAAGFLMGCTGTDGYPVTEGDTYTFSGYMRASVTGVNFLVRVFFFDETGASISTESGPITSSTANTWTRISHTVAVPAGAATLQFALDTGDGGTVLAATNTIDVTGVLVEKSGVLQNYFDGAYTDSDNPTLGEAKIEYLFTGDDFASSSVENTYTYVAGRDRSLNGPFGIVGRPRVAEVTWVGQGSSCATVLLRFDAIDHRMYVLDECGTPGSSDCVTMEPGSEIKCRTYPRCYDTSPDYSWCYDNASGGDSVAPQRAKVLGTETSYPIITLNPSLTNPRVEDTSSGKFISYRGTINAGEQPVVIYTEDGTAYQGDKSVTHLIGGSLDFSMDPGSHDLRLIVQSLTDTGTASVCWRPAVVAA